MKKLTTIMLVLLFVAAIAVVPALAGSGKVVVKGQVASLPVGSTVTITTTMGVLETVLLPADFDPTTLVVGDWLLVKGTRLEDGSIQAEFAKEVVLEDEDGDGVAEPGKASSAYCAEGMLHPVAVKLSEDYAADGVTAEWVNENFCAGFGMGQIMLALKTSPVPGMVGADLLLAQREAGMGWGQIWKEAGLVGSESQGQSPYGQLKKQEGEGTATHPGKGPKNDR